MAAVDHVNRNPLGPVRAWGFAAKGKPRVAYFSNVPSDLTGREDVGFSPCPARVNQLSITGKYLASERHGWLCYWAGHMEEEISPLDSVLDATSKIMID